MSHNHCSQDQISASNFCKASPLEPPPPSPCMTCPLPATLRTPCPLLLTQHPQWCPATARAAASCAGALPCTFKNPLLYNTPPPWPFCEQLQAIGAQLQAMRAAAGGARSCSCAADGWQGCSSLHAPQASMSYYSMCHTTLHAMSYNYLWMYSTCHVIPATLYVMSYNYLWMDCSLIDGSSCHASISMLCVIHSTIYASVVG